MHHDMLLVRKSKITSAHTHIHNYTQATSDTNSITNIMYKKWMSMQMVSSYVPAYMCAYVVWQYPICDAFNVAFGTKVVYIYTYMYIGIG